MMIDNTPHLFGINKSNRDYTNAETWGKNQFNSSFPAALACYLHSKKMKAVYVKADSSLESKIDYIGIDEIFRIDPLGKNTYFSFETQYTPFQKYVIGAIPRNDLVIHNLENDSCVSSFEIKLTALPDNSTCDLNEEEFGSEIVVRPDTIIYLACSFIQLYNDNQQELKSIIGNTCENIKDWTQAKTYYLILKILEMLLSKLYLKRINYKFQ